MKRKLYRIEIVAYVLANNEDDAKDIFSDEASINYLLEQADVNETLTVDEEWFDLAPYGTNIPCGELCEQLKKEIKNQENKGGEEEDAENN